MKGYFICFACLMFALPAINSIVAQEIESFRITVIYDNYVAEEGLKADWGFSCLIEGLDKTILFDTGTQEELFWHNMNHLNVDPDAVDIVFISHNHYDHTGGLLSFLEKNAGVDVYLPASTPEDYVKKVTDLGAKVYRENDPCELINGVYLTGEMGTGIKEQSMVFDTKKGLIVLTGCAHPGIVDIVAKAREIRKKDVYAVMGGFHLMNNTKPQIEAKIESFREMGVVQVGATHCTGEQQIEWFKEAFGKDYFGLGSGKMLHVTADGIK